MSTKNDDLPILEQDFIKVIRSLVGKYDIHTVWGDFITVCACTISNSVDKVRFKEREQEYLNIVTKYGKEGMDTFSRLFAATVLALEKNPRQDFLGTIYSHLSLQRQSAWAGIHPLSC